jgi:hypothetical protein
MIDRLEPISLILKLTDQQTKVNLFLINFLKQAHIRFSREIKKDTKPVEYFEIFLLILIYNQ